MDARHESESEPAGDPYDWYLRANELLAKGNPAAAAVLLTRLHAVAPESDSVLETLARALFDSHRFGEAVVHFRQLAERDPANDFAHYGLGMSLWRLQRFPEARDELSMAFVMRPERSDYAQALSQVKATIRARSEAGLPMEGPINT